MSNPSFYKWRAKFGGMDASLIAEMKEMAEQNRRLKKMCTEMSMQNDLLKEAAKTTPSHASSWMSRGLDRLIMNRPYAIALIHTGHRNVKSNIFIAQKLRPDCKARGQNKR